MNACNALKVTEMIRDLWDGKGIVDVDGKKRSIGKGLKEAYGESGSYMGERMLRELVFHSTKKPWSDAYYLVASNGDVRRIMDDMKRESDFMEKGYALGGKGIDVFRRNFFVKPAVFRRLSSTRRFRKDLNRSAAYERNAFFRYTSNLEKIRTKLRAAGFDLKSEKELDKLEKQISIEMSNPDGDPLPIIEDRMLKLSENGGRVAKQFIEVLELPLSEFDNFFRRETKFGEKLGRRKKELLDKDGNEINPMVIEAARDARKLFNDMGAVLVNGLGQTKKIIELRTFGTYGPTNLELKSNPLVKGVLKRLDSRIKKIKEGMGESGYFPHYILTAVKNYDNALDRALTKGDKKSYDKLEEMLDSIELGLRPPESAMERSSAFNTDLFQQNPLMVMKKYSSDAIFFNKSQWVRRAYEEVIRNLPTNMNNEQVHTMRRYIDEVYATNQKGYEDRFDWANKTVRLFTAYEFATKLGLNFANSVRNLGSGAYFIAGLGAKGFHSYMTNKNNQAYADVFNQLDVMERDAGFKFTEMSAPLFTEGLLPTKGIIKSDVEFILNFDATTGEPNGHFRYKEGKVWKTIDRSMSEANGKLSLFLRVTENFIRRHIFRASFFLTYKSLTEDVPREFLLSLSKKSMESADATDAKKVAVNISRDYALDMVNKYAFEYSPSEKAPIIGGTWRNWGAIGQVGFQFMHFPMSFVNLQSEVLRNSKDALLAKQWNNPEMYTPLYFASIYMMTAGLSGLFNKDFTRLVENDTVDKFIDFYKVFLSGDKKAKGRGFIGPGIGDLIFLTTLNELYEMPENKFTNYVLGYNNAYAMTSEEKASRLFATFPGVQFSKIVTRDLPAIANGRGTDILKNEFGIYPKKWTKKLQNWMLGSSKPFKGAWKPEKVGWKPGIKKEKTKTEAAYELDKLYRSMGI